MNEKQTKLEKIAPPGGLFLMKVFYDPAERNAYTLPCLPFLLN